MKFVRAHTSTMAFVYAEKRASLRSHRVARATDMIRVLLNNPFKYNTCQYTQRLEENGWKNAKSGLYLNQLNPNSVAMFGCELGFNLKFGF